MKETETKAKVFEKISNVCELVNNINKFLKDVKEISSIEELSTIIVIYYFE